MTDKTTQGLVERLWKHGSDLYSAMRSQQEDVKANGSNHPGLLEPMKAILERLNGNFEAILADMPALPDGIDQVREQCARIAEGYQSAKCTCGQCNIIRHIAAALRSNTEDQTNG